MGACAEEWKSISMSDINKQVFCIHCGKPIDEGDGFCKYCGKEQDIMKEVYGSKSKKEKPKRKWVKVLKIVLFSILGLGVLIGVGIGVFYLYEEYEVYQKRELRKKEIQDVILKFETGSDSLKIQYAWHILYKKFDWTKEGYKTEIGYNLGDSIIKEAFKYIEGKAIKGDARYQFYVANLYTFEDYRYPKVDLEKKVYWLTEAVKQNYCQAYNNLGVSYQYGEGVKINIKRAFELYTKGAECGDVYAQFNLGRMYIDGARQLIDTKTIRHLSETEYTNYYINYGGEDCRYTFIRREHGCDRQGNYFYGWLYDIYVPVYEELVSKDIEKAQYWWKKAAKQGHEGAIEALQKVYE